MIDLETLKQLGWTGLLVWNLKETVAHGKALAWMKAKLENGFAQDLGEMKRDLKAHMDGEEQRILVAVKRDPRARTRRTDRKREEADDA